MARASQHTANTRTRRIDELRRGLSDPLDKRTKEGKARQSRREFMEEARKIFQAWDDANEAQLRRENDDERFYAGEHWPADVKLSRAGLKANAGVPEIPARPCLVFDKLSEPVNQILNVERDADLGIELTPADDFEGLGVVLDETEIEIREGLIRRIQRESQAANARSWAFKRAVVAGRGWYGVMTRYAPGKTHDQELYVEGFYNQACVTPDPAHEQPDGSDMEGAFVGRWIPWSEYKSRWPDSAKKRNVISSLRDSDFIALGMEEPRWFKTNDKAKRDDKDSPLRMVYVADYFYTVKTPRTLYLLADGTSLWKEELPDDAEIVDEREVIERTVMWAKLDGANPEPLEETEWITPDVPVIKVVGEEVLPYDDERRVVGIVASAKDPNYGFDAMGSKVVEVVAQTPIPATVMAAGQDEGFTKEWDLSTTRSMGRLHYNFKDSDGQPVGPPTALQREPPPIQAMAMALSMFDEAVQTGTRSHDPSLGKVDPTLRSGRAIDAVVNRSKEGTSNFLDNLKRSIRREAEILNNGLYPTYGMRPGRLAKIINGQGESETIMLGRPYTVNGNKRPMPVPDGQPIPPTAKQFALTEYANCNINITIKRNSDTRRQEESEMLGGLISADPQLLAWYGDIFFKHRDGPGSQELAERAEVMLAPPIQQLIQAKKQGMQLSPQVAQKLALADQTIKQAQQEIQALQQKIAGKETENAGKLQITREQEAHEDQRAALDRETKIAIAELSAKVERLALFLEERARIGAHITDVRKTLHDQAHEVGTKVIDHAMATDLSAQEHKQTMQQNEQEHQHALEEDAQAAALAPATGADQPDTGTGPT